MNSRTWRQRGAGVCDAFSLVEIVIAISIIAFSMVAIIGMVSVSMSAHQDSANDSVLTLMTESALQEVRNVGFSGLSSTYQGYIYFDANGQITGDGSSSSYEVSTASSPSAAGIPKTSAAAVYPANTVYQCAITIAAPTAATYPYLSTTAPSLYEIILTFTWPVGAPAPAAAANPTATPRTRVVTATISNPN